MTPTFRDPALFSSLGQKLGRADAHAHDLLLHITEPNSVSLTVDLQPNTPYYRMLVTNLGPPQLWSLELGDAVHNLRSALDHLAWALVSDFGEKRPGSWVQFPIFTDDTEDGWTNPKRGARRTLAAIHPVHARMIEGIQPYQWRSIGKDPTQHPLAHLAKLDNDDKHRLLTTLIAKPIISGFDVRPLTDCDVISVTPHLGGPLDEDAVVGEWNAGNFGAAPKVQVETEFSAHIALPDGTDAVDSLGEIAQYIIRDVLAPLHISIDDKPGAIWE